ncbi:hypothetical protein FB451DRAFT_450751 [Mycena latifolia]|nr:hypothetical protein FB451DRAFT_450751 [Mycena latifolia]
MPPLTRQRTLESVLSWWSDSNPSGATINLHAVTKPLMMLMYHRQALGFVKRNHGLPLSPETLEIYWSYLSWKYVSTSTKLAILEELKTRAGSEEDAHVLIHSNTVYKILHLLRSSPLMHSWLNWPSAAILSNVASHSKSISSAVIDPLVALLRDSNENDVSFVSDFLSKITASQVTVLVERNHSVPLSPETVEIYSSYLLYAGLEFYARTMNVQRRTSAYADVYRIPSDLCQIH